MHLPQRRISSTLKNDNWNFLLKEIDRRWNGESKYKFFPSIIIIPITCDTSTSVLSGEIFLFFFLNPPSPALGSFPIFNSLEWFYCVLWWSVHPFDYNFFMFELHIIVIYIVSQSVSSSISCWKRYMFNKTNKMFDFSP